MKHRSRNDESSARLRITLLGNCQVTGLGRSMQAMLDGAELCWHLVGAAGVAHLDPSELDEKLTRSDLIFVHPHPWVASLFETRLAHLRERVRSLPVVIFAAFHPDMDYVFGPNGTVKGPMGEYHSALVFHAWHSGWSQLQAVELFREAVFRDLGYFDQWDSSVEWLCREGERCGLSMRPLIDRWSERGPWMHSLNHPRAWVLADIARLLLEREGLDVVDDQLDLLPDSLAEGPIWPIYPGIARQFGLIGHYRFKVAHAWDRPAERSPARWLGRTATRSRSPQALLPVVQLEAFIDGSYRAYESFGRGQLRCNRASLAWDRLSPNPAALVDASQRMPSVSAPARARRHPYALLPDRQFWRRAVSGQHPLGVDPVMSPTWRITPQDRVATAGSCFAQHIARTLQASGLNYFIAEPASDMLAPEAMRRQYGVYSARYGNLYTARQLLQLFERAHGRLEVQEPAWQREDGRWVDPFRPQIEPDGFVSPEAVIAARHEHHAAVRRMFAELDVFVFTLGLTEAWVSRADGAVFPLAPGVSGGLLDLRRHAFVNLGVSEVVADFRAFLARLWKINPRARVVLSVSPVAIMATYEHRHVLVSNSHTKAVLCAAAHEICAREPRCAYFPGYEMVMGAHARARFIEADLRSIRPEGVANVMRAFMRHFTTLGDEHPDASSGAAASASAVAAVTENQEALLQRHSLWQRIFCEEEALDVDP